MKVKGRLFMLKLPVCTTVQQLHSLYIYSDRQYNGTLYNPPIVHSQADKPGSTTVHS